MRILRQNYIRRATAFLTIMSGLSTLANAQFASSFCDSGVCETSSRNCDRYFPSGIIEAGEYPLEPSSPSDTSDFFPSQPTAGQPTPSQPTGPSGGFGDLNLISGSSPGDSFAAALAPGTYIDNAGVVNMFRTRFDAAYNNPLPDRAEFFYAQCGILGPQARGPAQVETSVDYQEFRPYFERAVTKNFSLFVETPIRLINPTVNDNTAGMGDLITGFKRALHACNGQYLTAQLKIYAPTGDADRGLGTGHASLEPGLLYLSSVNDRLAVQGEFRVWVPLSDAQVAGRGNHAGTVLRYGLGAGYDLLNLDSCCQRRRLTATFETVGWSITDGLALSSDGVNTQVIDVSGDTIVNLKTGLRYTAGRQSVAGSYGFAVTGDQWYSDIARVEYRYAF